VRHLSGRAIETFGDFLVMKRHGVKSGGPLLTKVPLLAPHVAGKGQDFLSCPHGNAEVIHFTSKAGWSVYERIATHRCGARTGYDRSLAQMSSSILKRRQTIELSGSDISQRKISPTSIRALH
jgi:hypothetical protein